jgi:hypothetical protein
MSALVAGHGDTLGIFFYGGFNQFLNGPVVGKVDDFYAGILKYSAHDVGRCIMTIKKRGGSDYSDDIFRPVNFDIHLHGSSFTHIW